MALVTIEMVKAAFQAVSEGTSIEESNHLLGVQLTPLFNMSDSGGGGGAVTRVTASGQIVATPASGVGDVALSHASSGVLAGSYGSSTQIPVFTVDSAGHITLCSTALASPASVPWANLTGTPSVTAGNGLTGGGSLAGSVTLSVNFAGSGALNTVARSDHRHDMAYVALDGTNSPMSGPLTSPNFIGASPQGGNGSGLITNGAVAWYQQSRSVDSRWWDMVFDVVTGELRVRALTDTGSTLATPIKFTRSGDTILGGKLTLQHLEMGDVIGSGGAGAGIFYSGRNTADSSFAGVYLNSTGDVYAAAASGRQFAVAVGGASVFAVSSSGATIGGSAVANSFAVPGGTASGFLKANGTVDTSTYLSGNQSISLTGDVTGTGATSIASTVLRLNGQALPSFGSTAANLRWSGTAWQMDTTPYASVGLLAAYATTAALSSGLAGLLPASGGTTNRVAKWTSSTTLGSGIITDDGDFVFADPGAATGGRFKSRYAGSKAQLVGNSNAANWWGVGTDGTTADMVRIGRTTSDGVFVADGFELSVLGNLRLPGCLFCDDVFSSLGYALYPSGVTPSASNAAFYFAKNGTLVAISGSASASLSVNGSPVATASTSGFSIPSLAGSGLLKAGAGGLLQAAAVADLPGGPFLPLSAGSSKPITGILSLQNNLEIMDGKSITSLGATVLTIGSPWYGPGILFPWTASTISGIDFQVDGRSKFVGLLNPAGGIAGDISGGDAPSQGVGEYITSALSNTETVSITATSIFDMTTIELPAGDWDVDATIIGKANIAAAARFRAAISTSTATIASDGREGESSPPTGSAIHSTLTMHKRIKTSASMTVYLSAQFICSSFGAASCWGSVTARRRR